LNRGFEGDISPSWGDRSVAEARGGWPPSGSRSQASAPVTSSPAFGTNNFLPIDLFPSKTHRYPVY